MRRWIVLASALLGLALASGVIGALTGRHDAPAKPQAAPFSYFPSQ